jgi:hypothetical protein
VENAAGDVHPNVLYVSANERKGKAKKKGDPTQVPIHLLQSHFHNRTQSAVFFK